METHTKGPWDLMPLDDNGRFDPLVMGPDCIEIAYVYAHREDQLETLANGALIAAAPDLYDACYAMRRANTPELITEAYRMIDVAIAAATGSEERA